MSGAAGSMSRIRGLIRACAKDRGEDDDGSWKQLSVGLLMLMRNRRIDCYRPFTNLLEAS